MKYFQIRIKTSTVIVILALTSAIACQIASDENSNPPDHSIRINQERG